MTRQAVRVMCYVACSLALMLVPGLSSAQDRGVTISGRVTGAEAGAPLTAANVSIPELNIAVPVGQDGRYRLVVPAARVQGQMVNLVARMIGYQASTVPVRLNAGETLDRDFSLRQDPLRLQEVVVTGAGTASMVEALGTARASVAPADIQRAGTPQNVVASLAGKVPNVAVAQGSGDAGSSASIQIRGAKTFGTSQPVFVIDGVVMSNATRGSFNNVAPNRTADINPEDIESIEILKGAAASSIYGASAGSAGAILITTKRGRAGRSQLTLRSSYQADQPIKYLPFQTTYGMGSNNVSTACTTLNCQVAAGSARSWGPAIPAGTPRYDHSREIYETGGLMDNTLSLSGGNERASFYLSAGGMNHDGFIVGDKDFMRR